MNIHHKYLDYSAIISIMLMLIVTAGVYMTGKLNEHTMFFIAIPAYIHFVLLIRYLQIAALFWLLLIAAYIYGWFFIAVFILLGFDIVFRRVF